MSLDAPESATYLSCNKDVQLRGPAKTAPPRNSSFLPQLLSNFSLLSAGISVACRSWPSSAEAGGILHRDRGSRPRFAWRDLCFYAPCLRTTQVSEPVSRHAHKQIRTTAPPH